MYICIYTYIIYIILYVWEIYIYIYISNLKVHKKEEERSKKGHISRTTSWGLQKLGQLIDTSAWFLNQVNSGPNQHL